MPILSAVVAATLTRGLGVARGRIGPPAEGLLRSRVFTLPSFDFPLDFVSGFNYIRKELFQLDSVKSDQG